MRFTCLAVVAALALAAPATAAETVDNPEFASWAKHKKGTSITMKITANVGGTATEITNTSTLIEVGKDKVVIEITGFSKIGGKQTKTPPSRQEIPRTLTLPKGVQKPDPTGKPLGTSEEGTETLKVGGAEVKTRWYKYSSEVGGSKIVSKMWRSDDVPGNLVRMESTTTGSSAGTSKMELVAIKKP